MQWSQLTMDRNTGSEKQNKKPITPSKCFTQTCCHSSRKWTETLPRNPSCPGAHYAGQAGLVLELTEGTFGTVRFCLPLAPNQPIQPQRKHLREGEHSGSCSHRVPTSERNPAASFTVLNIFKRHLWGPLQNDKGCSATPGI